MGGYRNPLLCAARLPGWLAGASFSHRTCFRRAAWGVKSKRKPPLLPGSQGDSPGPRLLATLLLGAQGDWAGAQTSLAPRLPGRQPGASFSSHTLFLAGAGTLVWNANPPSLPGSQGHSPGPRFLATLCSSGRREVRPGHSLPRCLAPMVAFRGPRLSGGSLTEHGVAEHEFRGRVPSGRQLDRPEHSFELLLGLGQGELTVVVGGVRQVNRAPPLVSRYGSW